MEIRNLLHTFHRVENSSGEILPVVPRVRSSTSQSLGATIATAGDHADLRATKALSQAEAVRADKIKVTQAAIQAGTYHVSAGDVADHLINELRSY